jgi:GAF domain-containing protein
MDGGSSARVQSEYEQLLTRLEVARETEVLEQALAAAQERLGMDASYLTTIDSRNQTIHAMVGDADIVNRYQGTVFALEQTYCMRMLSGQIPNAVPDTEAEAAISDLDASREFHAYVGVPVRLSAMSGRTNSDVLVLGAVIPVDQTYCARMLKGEIPNIVPDVSAEPGLRNVTAIRNIGAYIGVPVELSDGRVHGSLCCASNEPRPELGEPELRFMQVLAAIVAARLERAQGSMVRLAKRFAAARPDA